MRINKITDLSLITHKYYQTYENLSHLTNRFANNKSEII